MARKKRAPMQITLHRHPDGTYRFGKVGETLPGGGDFDVTTGVARDLSTGLVIGPGSPGPLQPDDKSLKGLLGRRLHVLPPVPGSIGRWTGKGTTKDPMHWRGVDAKLVAEIGGVLLALWGIQVIAIDVSNWWSGSVMNLGQDLSNWETRVLASLGITTYDAQGNPIKVGGIGQHPRQHATFWTWLLNQVAVQGGDLQQAVTTVNGLAVGLSPGPPAIAGTSTGGTIGQPTTPCPPGYTLTPVLDQGAIRWVCKLNGSS